MTYLGDCTIELHRDGNVKNIRVRTDAENDAIRGHVAMLTIWFSAFGKKYSVDCEVLWQAQQIWDSLALQFNMVSARP